MVTIDINDNRRSLAGAGQLMTIEYVHLILNVNNGNRHGIDSIYNV